MFNKLKEKISNDINIYNIKKENDKIQKKKKNVRKNNPHL